MCIRDRTYLFRGKVTGTFLRREMLAPEFLPQAKGLSIQPVYPATAGLSLSLIHI